MCHPATDNDNSKSLLAQQYLAMSFPHFKTVALKDDLLLLPQTTPANLSIIRQYVTVAIKYYIKVSV